MVNAQESAVGTSLIPASATAEVPTNWGVSFYSLGSVAQQQIERGGASYFAYNYIGLNYRLSKTTRFLIRPVFNYTSSGKDKFNKDVKSDTTLGDLHLVYADYEIATLGEANVSTSFKFYLPTSQGAQESGMIVKFRPETFVALDVGRFDTMTYILKPDFFLQSRGSYLDAFNKDKTTQIANLEHSIEYGRSLSKIFTLKPSVGFIEAWYNPTKDPKFNTHKTEAKIALGLDIRAAKGLSFTLSAENRFFVANRKDEIAFFRPEENGLVFITNASM
jgi:hypothetical protein